MTVDMMRGKIDFYSQSLQLTFKVKMSNFEFKGVFDEINITMMIRTSTLLGIDSKHDMDIFGSKYNNIIFENLEKKGGFKAIFSFFHTRAGRGKRKRRTGEEEAAGGYFSHPMYILFLYRGRKRDEKKRGKKEEPP